MHGAEKDGGLGSGGWGWGRLYCVLQDEIVTVTSFAKRLLFNSSSSARRAQLWEPHLHAYGYLIGSVQRYSRSQSDCIWCAYKWSSQSGVWCFMRDRENMLSLLHPKSNGNLGIFFSLAWDKQECKLKKMHIYVHIYICVCLCMCIFPSSPSSEFTFWTKGSLWMKPQKLS